MTDQENKNKELLGDFVKYCKKHPDQHFWQALRNWSNQPFILVADDINDPIDLEDTFYWETKDGRQRPGA